MNEITFRLFFTEIGLTPPPFDYDFRQWEEEFQYRVTFKFKHLIYQSEWCATKLEAMERVVEIFFESFIVEVNEEKARERKMTTNPLKLYIGTSQSLSPLSPTLQQLQLVEFEENENKTMV